MSQKHLEERRRLAGHLTGGFDPHRLVFRLVESLRTGEVVRVSLLDDGMLSVQCDGWLGKSLEDFFATDEAYDGLFAANVLSEWCTTEIRHNGFVWGQKFEKGEPITDLTPIRPLTPEDVIGTSFTFKLDFSVLKQTAFDYDLAVHHLYQIAGLYGGTKIVLVDERSGEEQQSATISCENGLADFIQYLTLNNKLLYPPVHGYAHYDRMFVEVALQYTSSDITYQVGYTNAERANNGAHHRGFVEALVNFHSLTSGVSLQDILPGLIAIISIHYDVSSGNLANRDRQIENAVFELTLITLAQYAKKYPDETQKMIDRCLVNKKAREQE